MNRIIRPEALRESDDEIIRICYPFPLKPTNPRSAEFLDFKQHVEAALHHLRSVSHVFEAAAAMAMPPLYFVRPGLLQNARATIVGIMRDLIHSRTHISIAKALSLWEAHLSEEGIRRVAGNESSTLVFAPQSMQQRDPKTISRGSEQTDVEYNLEVHTAQLIYMLFPVDYAIRTLPNSMASGLCNPKFLEDALPLVRSAMAEWVNPHGKRIMIWVTEQWILRMDAFIESSRIFESAAHSEMDNFA